MPTRTQKQHARTLWRVTGPDGTGAKVQKQIQKPYEFMGFLDSGAQTFYEFKTKAFYYQTQTSMCVLGKQGCMPGPVPHDGCKVLLINTCFCKTDG